MDLKKLGSRIKMKREKRRLKQTDIAGALQISAQAVSKWERGENAPDISVLMELSCLLGVSVEWLLGGTMAETDTFNATVFCTGLNGFAGKATLMAPGELALWMNIIHYTVTEAVKRFDGVPVKYIGDGFLGFFTGINHEARALDAAKESRRLLDMHELVITLHKGDIFLGLMGHPDYERPDIIGETVNTAFLIMPCVAKNCKTGIGLTDTVMDELAEREEFVKCGEIIVSDNKSPVIIYEPFIEKL
jgi:transcriptional regulator with XRE-family HTH domain